MQGRIELIGASKEISGQRILDNLNLTIEAGEFLCLLGPSGCGKTTLLRSIAGISELSGGRILLDGVDITHTPAEKRDIGMVFQHLALFPHMTIEQNVGYGLRLRKVAKEEILERTRAILNSFDLPELARRYPHELSGGQKQRVAIARALITRPAALLFDEPLGALDTKLRHHMIQELRDLHRELKTTFVFVTHDQGEAFSLGDRVALMREGRFAQISAPEELYHRPHDEFVADFVGAANVITASVLPDGRIDAYGSALDVSDTLRPGTPVAIMIRPEDLSFTNDGPIAGLVVDRRFGGPVSTYRISVDDETLSISVASATEPSLNLGDAVRLAVAPDRIRVVEHGE